MNIDQSTAVLVAITSIITGALAAWASYRLTIAQAKNTDANTRLAPANLALSTTSAATQMAGSGAQLVVTLQQQLDELLVDLNAERERRQGCEDQRATNLITVRRVSRILKNLLEEHDKQPQSEKCPFAATQNKTIMSVMYLLEVEFIPKKEITDEGHQAV